MNKEESIAYAIKLLVELGLREEKIPYTQEELSKKDAGVIDEILIKLEAYYTNQNLVDKEFIRKLERIGNQIDESMESTVEKFNIENLIF